MPAVTYYVALPFTRGEDGDISAGEARECPSSGAARREAARMAAANAGAVAYSRSGDPAAGEFDDAKILEVFGETPPFDSLFG